MRKPPENRKLINSDVKHGEETKRDLLDNIFHLIRKNDEERIKESCSALSDSKNTFFLNVLDNQKIALECCASVLNNESPLSELTKLYNDRNKTADGVQYQHTLFGRITSGLWSNDVVEVMRAVLNFMPQPNPALPLQDSLVNRI